MMHVPNGPEVGVSKFVVALEVKVNLSVVLKKLHLEYASAQHSFILYNTQH